MTPRPAFTLIHVIFCLAIIVVLATVLAALFQGTFTDIPRLLRLTNANTEIAHITRTIQQDITTAHACPPFDPDRLTLQLPDCLITYYWQDETLTRTVTGPETQQTDWHLPQARITWSPQRDDHRRTYAIALTKYVIHKPPGRTKQRMKTTYLTFLNSDPARATQP